MKTMLFVILSVVLFLGPMTLFAQTEDVYHEMAGYYQMKEVAPGVRKLIRTEDRAYVYYKTHGSKLIEASAGEVGGFWDGRWHKGPQLLHIRFTGEPPERHWYVLRLDADSVFIFETPKAVFPKKVAKREDGASFQETIID